MKITKTAFCLAGALLAFGRVDGGEAAWFPLVGNPETGFVSLDRIVQMGSEVALLSVSQLHGVADQPLPLRPVEIDFPTLFIVGCWDVRQGYYELPPPDNVIYDSRPVGTYDPEIGDGWIHHRRAAPPVHDGPWLEPSLGWIYIRQYPWVWGVEWGWRYVIESEIAWHDNSWWFYEPDLGWFWTTRNTYPWIHLPEAGWEIYGEESAAS